VAIARGIIVCWPSTNASIPAGWTRETSLDGFYIQGAAAAADADLTTVRGNASHTHTSPNHTPLQDFHVHNLTDGGNDGSSLVAGSGTPAVQDSPSTHLHPTPTDDGTTGTNDPVAITVDAATNDLTYKKVIFIKSAGSPTSIPFNAYSFFESDTLPASWTRVVGNTYLKGAAAAGDGGATGGSTSHNHTSPAHTHTQQAHSHTGNSGPIDLGVSRKSVAGSTVAKGAHTHALTGNANTATNQSVTTTISTTTAEPVYKKLNVISNGKTGGDLPDKIIALWGGTNAGIPKAWARYTSMDGKFHKGANADGESNVSTGGSLTHTHTADDCLPIQNSHFHSWTGATSTLNIGITGVGFNISPATHTHTWTDDGTTVIGNFAASVSIDTSASEAHYPQYKRVIFIKFDRAAYLKLQTRPDSLHVIKPTTKPKRKLTRKEIEELMIKRHMDLQDEEAFLLLLMELEL
jgi:hypothetical protein